MVDGYAKTPRYVLKEGSYPSCPSVLQTSSDNHAVVIYGFSDKPEYDAFLSGSSLALTPYPLVKGFLKNQINLDSGSLKLVVLDAGYSAEQCLYAATFQSVLKSFQSDLECVTVSHRLVLEASAPLYRIEVFSFFSPAEPLS
ncbi:hypothetical protein N9N28_14250 [Rubripirellula amarantea]|nr:hypothetical protein [Rubripirellula amarantea]